MWYFGGDQTAVSINQFTAKGLQMRAGCAVSRDGINWVRLDGPYRGAVLDVGAGGAFDAFYCAWPKVVRDESGWKLYYHSLSDGIFRVGLATSRDGLRWEKVGPVLGPGKPGSFDERGVGTRHVLRINGESVMFYEGVDGTGYHSIGLALSDDGVRWRRGGDGDFRSAGPYARPERLRSLGCGGHRYTLCRADAGWQFSHVLCRRQRRRSGRTFIALSDRSGRERGIRLSQVASLGRVLSPTFCTSDPTIDRRNGRAPKRGQVGLRLSANPCPDLQDIVALPTQKFEKW